MPTAKPTSTQKTEEETMNQPQNDTNPAASTEADLSTTSAEEENFLLADVTIEDRSFGRQLPLVQWINGDPTKKREGGIAYTGGFFFTRDQGIKIPGAEPYVMVTKDGEDIDGFAIRDLRGAIVRYRRGWMATPKDGLPARFANSEYDEAVAYGKVRGQTHVIFLPEGCEDYVMLTFRGLGSKAVAGMGKESGAIVRFANRVLGTANRLAKKDGRKTTYPLCAFKITLGPARLADGSPDFTEVGKKPDTSMVTFPEWVDGIEGDITSATLNSLYVGKLFGSLQAEFTATESWTEDWSEESLLARRTRGAKNSGAPVQNGTDGRPASNEVPF